MKKALTVVMVILLFNSCKKEENTWEYWDDLATKKMQEITNLSNNYACSEIENLTIQNTYNFCSFDILIHKNDIQKFNELNKQYQEYKRKANEAGRPMVYYDCLFDKPIKIGCKENKAYLVFTYNISLEDLNIEMPKLYTEIKNHYNSLNCENINNLTGVTLYTDNVEEAIAIRATDLDFWQKVQTYKLLNQRKAQLENKQFNLNYNLKVIVKCENNSIKAEFE
jgi:hypothetical protein